MKNENKDVSSKPNYDNLYDDSANHSFLTDQSILENGSCVVVVKGNKIIDCNSSTERLFSLSKEELKNLSIVDLFAKHNEKHIEEFLNGNVLSTCSYNTQLKINNDEIKVAVQINPLVIEDNSYAYIHITTKAADAFSKFKTAFLQKINHEMRTPLNSILGFTQIMKYKSINDIKKHQYLDIIEKKSVEFLDVINKIIELSELESDNLSIIAFEFEIDSFLEQFKQRYENIQFINNYKANKVTTDSNMLFKAIRYIIDNAIKFSSEQIIVIVDERNDNVVFTVTDNGIGIAADKLNSIFEAFEQLNSSKTFYNDGLGISLSIANNLIRTLGGNISVESQLGKGSSFHVTIPKVYNNQLRYFE